MHVEQPGLSGVVHILNRPTAAQHAKYGIVETLGFRSIAATDHHVIQHGILSLCDFLNLCRSLAVYLRLRQLPVQDLPADPVTGVE